MSNSNNQQNQAAEDLPDEADMDDLELDQVSEELPYDDNEAQEQIDDFFQEVQEEEDNDEQEHDYYCARHRLGFDDYEKYARHMIAQDKIIAYRRGIARFFCRFCRRLFITKSRKNNHEELCRSRRHGIRRLNNRQRARQDLLRQLNFQD
ncbi:hypothetical protein ABPG72_020337 [Tetrahymena utriculariae]